MSGAARLVVALLLLAALTLFECVGGFVAHSLALLSDSAHVAMDVLALGIALAARLQSQRPATNRQSFGFARLEVLAALANGGFLFAVIGALSVAAVRRFFVPEVPQGAVMATVAAVGFVLNLFVGFTLLGDPRARGFHLHGHGHDQGDLNIRAALLHVFGDALGALVVLLGGLAILWTRIAWIDPLLSLVVAVVLAIGTFGIMRVAVDVLLESTPEQADLVTVREYLLTLEGVVDIHDLHVWSLDGREHLLTAHVLLDDRRISEASAILRQVESGVRARFKITHVTLQFECESCEENERVVCTQRPG